MVRVFAHCLLAALVAGLGTTFVVAQAPAGQAATPAAAAANGASAADQDAPSSAPASELQPLPAAPRGKSTIMGGEIQKVDPVRDVLTLKVYGQKPMTIFFDERSQVFRDGKKIPLRELKPTEHASVQTILDGTNVFALSVHVLSKSPEGDYQGNVLSYDPASTELTLSSGISRQPMKLLVPAATQVVRVGQPAFTAGQSGISDLVKGALVTVTFQTDKAAHGVATKIVILATPGAEFAFNGNITALDTHAGTLSLVDPRDDKSYAITFSPGALPETDKLHIGQHVAVTTNFDGSSYVAKTITAE